VNVSQPNDWNVPEQKDEKQENDAGKDQQSDKDSLFWPNLQRIPLSPFVNARIEIGEPIRHRYCTRLQDLRPVEFAAGPFRNAQTQEIN